MANKLLSIVVGVILSITNLALVAIGFSIPTDTVVWKLVLLICLGVVGIYFSAACFRSVSTLGKMLGWVGITLGAVSLIGLLITMLHPYMS